MIKSISHCFHSVRAENVGTMLQPKLRATLGPVCLCGAKPPSHGGMCGSFRGRSTTVRGLLFWLLALSPVSSIFVNTPAELQAFKGEAVTVVLHFHFLQHTNQ
ncbi:hypothetical protein fugu_010942 [Takifugu bimaculatus]|uniref:Uncharacterized protein n=1 Tax=Takifugu bimaculatus TaxID=433685 RepID=A0A4Z2CBM3_9TELE|nr:hypothetical protein fugu_010942 [Takifugu bimaculatus]